MKRICKESKDILIPYIPRLLDEISMIDQASTKWTLSQLFDVLMKDMDMSQQEKAIEIMKNNLDAETDWIVLNTTMETLSKLAKKDSRLKDWLTPRLEKLTEDTRKSESKKADKWLKVLQK